ncbi:hypothetical protein JIN85_19690 [Luteolibacter pohnpeiensis]|uniref:Uncharacterized protein n=1 Tax=Luteolibacter pohnpeiensis TaxID=454153 RepID=A0A934VY89_9BACT|nr:hypothetical protein [Luteolibacter pohnpeiensis]MBK1884648.1 hypothetical protein [Luteolibacter pohnpeiensis]
MQNKPVVATADKLASSLRSGCSTPLCHTSNVLHIYEQHDDQLYQPAGRVIMGRVLRVFTGITIFAAVYVWVVMCLGVLSIVDQMGIGGLLELGVDYSWAFALDSVCLCILLAVYFLRCSARWALVGVGFTVISFTLREAEFLRPDNHSMFWFEPFLRSGVYGLSFILAYFAMRIRGIPSIS